MKTKFMLSIILLFIASSIAVADDGWEDFSGIDRAWDGQKSITNKEFEQAIDTLEGNKKKKEAKKRKKLIKKVGGGGTSLHSDLNPDNNINDITPLSKNEEGLLLNVPVNLVVDGKILEKGFYKILSEKDDNNEIYLLFYQAHTLLGKVRANKTEDDYDEETIDFVNLLPYNDKFVKLIFGSLEFNAYAYLRYES